LQKTSNREEMALKVEEECFYCAQIIRKAGSVRTNLFASLTDKTKLNKFKEYYKNNETLYAELNKLSEANTINRTKLEELFKNYQAHHVIPVNVIKDSENLQELLAHVQKRGLNFEFNNFDNLIFLHKENHLGPHGEYDKQIIKIVDNISIRNLDKAVTNFKKEISEIKNKFTTKVIGHKIKINDIKL